MIIKIKKTWETVYFQAQQGENVEIVELNYNHDTKTLDLTTAHEEGVSFTGNTIEQAELKVEALIEAIKYLKNI